jgi:hypothetical protein
MAAAPGDALCGDQLVRILLTVDDDTVLAADFWPFADDRSARAWRPARSGQGQRRAIMIRAGPVADR